MATQLIFKFVFPERLHISIYASAVSGRLSFLLPVVAEDSTRGLTMLSWPPSLLARVAAFASLQWFMNFVSS